MREVRYQDLTPVMKEAIAGMERVLRRAFTNWADWELPAPGPGSWYESYMAPNGGGVEIVVHLAEDPCSVLSPLPELGQRGMRGLYYRLPYTYEVCSIVGLGYF